MRCTFGFGEQIDNLCFPVLIHESAERAGGWMRRIVSDGRGGEKGGSGASRSCLW